MSLAIPKEDLRKEINEILKNSDLEKTSSKEVRTKLEKKLNIDLSSRKKELDKLIMQCVNAMNSSESEQSESEGEDVKPAKKKRKTSDDEDDYKPSKAKKKKGSDSDSEEYTEKKKSGGKKAKYNGFTRPYTLSPELASLMGKKEMPRHEVVKRVWAIIKERDLYDPSNKQYAICDKDLEKVIGVKRFRTFGMMKYLSPHLIK